MDMTETVTPPAKPKKKRKARKVARAAAPKETGPAAAAFPGLTESVCAAACSIKGCIISGNSICGHPRKGGLRNHDPAALARLQLAQKQLGMDAVGKRFS